MAYGLDKIEPARDIRIILIEAAPRILPALPERIATATVSLLRSLDIDVRAGAKVAEVRADGVVLESGEAIPAELVVWAAGVKAPEVLRGIGGLETNRQNQLVVEPTLQTTRDASVFAIGDCASCPNGPGGAPIPPRAQAAHQMASHMIGQIERRLKGQPLTPFRYRDFGSLVTLGRYTTVGNIMGFAVGRSVFVEGMIARLMYRSLYKMHQAALHGSGRVAWRTALSALGNKPMTQIKLH